MDLARDYLRQAKGIQPLIEASKAGLPVDMTSIPLSPLEKVELTTSQKDDNFVLVSSEDVIEGLDGTDDKIYENLETQLIKQIKVIIKCHIVKKKIYIMKKLTHINTCILY